MTQTCRRAFLSSLPWALLITPALAQTTRPAYVDWRSTASNGGDGTSWSTAYQDLQVAIDKTARAQGTSPRVAEIHVAKGLYPTTQSSQNLNPTTQRAESFHLIRAVRILGGYRGLSDPSNADVRDIAANETTLSGDLFPDDPDDSNNAYNVIDCREHRSLAATGTTAVLDGFTITGGNGGAIVDIGSVTYRMGAGIYCPGSERPTTTPSSPTITNCRIVANRIYVPANPEYGGGMYIGRGCAPQVVGCAFQENLAGYGGGLYLESPGANLRIEQSTFANNTATEAGGGGVYVNNSSDGDRVRLLNCKFLQNDARKESGGGVLAVAPSTGILELFNCLFDRNKAAVHGGGVFATSSSVLTITNCTLFGNRATSGEGGGLYLSSNSVATTTNCILWNNASNASADFDKQVAVELGSNCLLTYSDVQGCMSCGSTNIWTDPSFFDSVHANYHLASGSPCLDNGDNGAFSGTGISVDLDQNARIFPVSGGTVDRGAYERPGVYDSDCNNNGIDDRCETLGCGASGCSDVAGCGTAPDCNGNHIPDACDIADGHSGDCNGDGIPNECQGLPDSGDCNHNCIPDACDISCGASGCAGYVGCGQSTDCNGNGEPDECEFVRPLVVTTPDDFNRGTLINVGTVNTGTAGQLQRNTVQQTKPLPFVWFPLVKGGETVVRIDAAASQPAGAILGEYHTAPHQHFDPSMVVVTASPGRIAVDQDGSAWVGNEADEFGNTSSAVKIGVVIGGTRVNEHGALDTQGEYLKQPFNYCTCEDRDGDGLIKTSRGLGDVLPWDNVDGRDDPGLGPVYNAEDECIVRYSRATVALDIRLVTVDRNNDIWVGGSSNHYHEMINGATGQAIGTSFSTGGVGGFNGLVDCANVLWSASNSGPLIRIDLADTSTQLPTTMPTGRTFDVGIDLSGRIWVPTFIDGATGSVARVSPDGLTVTPLPTGGDDGDAGVVIAPADGNVWIANSGANEDGKNVSRLDSSGNLRKVITLDPLHPTVAQKPAGLAVDHAGKVWTSCTASGSIKRINPGGDTDGLGAVDLSITPNPPVSPEAYGDLTGMVGLQTGAVGTWEIVHDAVNVGTRWSCIRWNTDSSCPSQPAGTSIVVSIRTADGRLALTTQPYTDVTNHADLSSFYGRFLEVRARLKGTCPEGTAATPVLCDLSVLPKMSCMKGDCNGDGFVNGRDIQPFVDLLLGGQTCGLGLCGADMDSSGSVTVADLPCFRSKLLNPSGTTSCDTMTPCGTFDTPSPRSGDCNTNGVPDDNDIADGTSHDCNNNFIPDECDIAAGDPDGDGHVSNDVDGNGVPDECQPDCNHNNVPDAKDIADATSADVNFNGVPDSCEADCNHNSIPDSWDISQHTSADCNANGIPDSCEADCNSNGVPDDCDIDPTDPDGDAIVYPDCNNSSLPDECDFDLPLRPSYDCNENGIPDECDIASAYSQDANQNGIPDECDYELGRSAGESAVDEEAAWLAFYEWQIDEHAALSAMSPVERFEATVDMLRELGLPEAIPWARVNAP